MVVHLFQGCCSFAVMESGSNSALGAFFILPKVTFELNFIIPFILYTIVNRVELIPKAVCHPFNCFCS